ncbi:MAG: hypothetical protein QOK42_1040 [Frankiaceae bacterium]|jgi:signal transduction histidine kinase|nr:hypothetical protein [Frankiaceae bacterium]
MRRSFQVLIGAAAVIAAYSSWSSPHAPQLRWILTGFSYIGVGLWVWHRRPESRTGPLLIITGWAVWSSIAEATRVPLFWTLGSALEASWLPPLAFLMLSFPSGKLTSTAQRIVFWLCVGFVAVAGVAGSFVYDPRDFGCTNCQPRLNLILVHSSPDYVRYWGGLVVAAAFAVGLLGYSGWRARRGSRNERRVFLAGASAFVVAATVTLLWTSAVRTAFRVMPIAVVLLLALVVMIVTRWWRASAPLQRVLSPMLFPAVAFCLAVAAQQAIGGLLNLWTVFRPSPYIFRLITDIAVFAAMSLPLTFLLGLARTRARHLVVRDLVVQLGELPPLQELERVLSRTLRDPSLAVGRWDVERGEYVDTAGQPMLLPTEGSGRSTTLLEREGNPLAAIVHDDALLEDDGLLSSVATAARFVVENEGLQAEVRAQLEDVRASRARIVAAAQEERRRLERDLHDGAQQRLVSVCLDLKLAASAGEHEVPPQTRRLLVDASTELERALAELRELARGIHPAVLTDEGLGPALRSLADRSRLPTEVDFQVGERLGAQVEAAAYFVASEALANVAKHAKATRASVAVSRPNGHLVIRVEDDGVGGADPERGSGLRGLIDRVGAVDGRLELTTTPGGGTAVVAEIPCA